jgi:hypothetical protein
VEVSVNLTSLVNRNYAEDQRKRAARQIRELVNINKQGQPLLNSVPRASGPALVSF